MRMIAAALAVLTVGCFEDAPPLESDTGDGGTTQGSVDGSATAMNDATADASTVGDEEDDDDDDDDSTGTTDPTAPVECAPDSVCVAAAPTGWLGPVAFTADALRTPSCAAPYDIEIAQLHAGIETDGSTCGCSCSGPLPGCTGSFVTYLDNGCEGDATAAVPADPGECTGILGTPPSIGVIGVAGAVQACESLGTEELGGWSWADDVAVCGPPEPPSGCGDGVCAPLADPSFTQLCIYREGDNDCPDETYSDRHVFHADATDTRACSACECALAVPDCSPQVWLSNDVSACEDADGPFMTSSCLGVGPSHVAAYWEPLNAGACSPTPSELTGDVTPTEASTVCCKP